MHLLLSVISDFSPKANSSTSTACSLLPNKGKQGREKSKVVRKQPVKFLNTWGAPPLIAAAAAAVLIAAMSPLHKIPGCLALALPQTPENEIEIVIERGGGALFSQACIGCHVGGGNIIQPAATLFSTDLRRNGADSEDEIYHITYYGKGRMPGFGEKCKPRGQCTFGPRLQEEEIRILAKFVKIQADRGWPNP